ncbi:methyl-accepting chemotaxis protein [Desulfonatronum thioautotrophicum]|uniref:methyl-accepting chemotaxis protein n=1 Tax=Desulfonatronum thioautotrophicum TaxID=617001 RepID=UPI0005EB6300|nr:methyl-accepting chemotaxis protein [Desulfonatronum thioautotrophicum]
MINIRSLNTQLILVVALSVSLAVGALVFYVNKSTYDMALALQTRTMHNVSDSTSQVLENYIHNLASLTASLAAQNAFESALQSDYFRQDAARIITNFMSGYPDIWAVSLFDADGEVVVGYTADDQDLTGMSLRDEPFLQQVFTQGEVVMERRVRRVHNAAVPTLNAAAVVRDLTGDVAGGVSVAMRWENFTGQFIDSISVGRSGFAAILDHAGHVVAHGRDPGRILSMSTEDGLGRAMHVEEGLLSFLQDGQAMFMAITTMPLNNWRVLTVLEAAEMRTVPGQQRNILIVCGTIMVLLLTTLIIVFLKRYVMNPLASIESFADRITHGDLGARLDGRFRFELAELADNLSVMVQELKNKLGFSEGVLQSISANFPFLVLDNHFRIIHTNHLLLEILDKDGTPEKYLQQDAGLFFHGESGRQTRSTQALQEKRRVEGEMEVLVKGRKKILSVNANPIYDWDGNLTGVLTLYYDLTTIREQEAEIKAKNAQIQGVAAQVQEISQQVSSAVDRIALQVAQASRGAGQQEQRSAETATAMEEMNASVQEIAANADHAARGSEGTKARAEEGHGLVLQVVESITKVQDQARSVQENMDILGDRARDIGRVITVIEDIADQTNLLALNAAIEAARAGDAGRGFAVVADEVRKLAEKTMSATQEVSASIASIQDGANRSIDAVQLAANHVAASVDLATRSNTSLREITGLAEGSASQVAAMAAASKEQSTACEEISRAVSEISKVSTQTAQGMAQTEQELAGLVEQVRRLRDLIQEMQVAE